MKIKIVFLIIMASITLPAFAQKALPNKSRTVKIIPLNYLQKGNIPGNDNPVSNQSASVKAGAKSKKKGGGKATQSIGTVPCGSSYNLYSVLNPATTAVTADPNLGVILFTHREDDSKFATWGNGAYEASVSTNMGASWDTSTIIFKNITTRYPNGVIFNPQGNTVLNNAYWVTNGTVAGANSSDQWSGWDSAALGNMNFGGTYLAQVYKANKDIGVLTENNIQCMSVSNDSTTHSIGDGYVYNSTISSNTYMGSCVNTCKFNSSAHQFNWVQTLFRPHLLAYDSALTQYDTIPQIIGNSGTAWSQDGKTGYVVIFGNLDSIDASSGANLNFVSFQPIVYKTVNSGANWNMMTPHNWKNDSVLVKYLQPTADSSAVTLPLWRLFHNAGAMYADDDYSLVVDENNNLHIIGGITSSAIANYDSSEYIAYFNATKDMVFDMYTTSPTGGWRARYIDSLASFPTQLVTAAETGNWNSTGTGPLSFGHRIQATRTIDGGKIFVTWLDDVVSDMDSIYFPDMFSEGYDVSSGASTPVKQLTNTSDCYFICVSNIALSAGSSSLFKIPVVRIEYPESFNDGSLPVYYVYDTTCVFDSNDFRSYANAISGTVYIDNNHNCIYDTGDVALPNVPMKAIHSDHTVDYAMSNFNGLYQFPAFSGEKVIVEIDSSAYSGYKVICPSIGFDSAIAPSTNNNLAASCSNGFDLSGCLSICVDTPGFSQASVSACIYNLRCLPVNGTMELILDTAIHYFYPYADTLPIVHGDTLVWNFKNLSPLTTLNQCVTIFGAVSSIPVGDSVFAKLIVLPVTGDSVPSNNTITEWVKAFPYNCVGLPYDPNDKAVSPAGNINPSQRLTYTIHFQNTGTALAQNVVVIDTLSPYLDVATLNIVSSSSPMSVQISNGNIATFTFNNINLPDTGTSKTASIGTVIYSISPLSGITNGTTIRNTAGIYFDANSPVITNTTFSKVDTSILSSVKEIVAPLGHIACFPNPFSSTTTIVFSTAGNHYLEIDDMFGRKCEAIECNGKQYELSRNGLAAGIYFVKAFDNGQKYIATTKLVLQ